MRTPLTPPDVALENKPGSEPEWARESLPSAAEPVPHANLTTAAAVEVA